MTSAAVGSRRLTAWAAADGAEIRQRARHTADAASSKGRSPKLTRIDPAPLGAFLCLLCLSARAAIGQCALQWQPGDAIPFVHGNARATAVWDPDGAGPAPAVLVVGGKLGVGPMLRTCIAAFDGTTWTALGALPLPEVTALTTWRRQLVAAGGVGSQHSIATWNGTAWSVLGSTLGYVNTMTVFQGNLVVGGSFSTVNGLAVHDIAQWNGSAWSPIGLGCSSRVDALVLDDGGATWRREPGGRWLPTSP